MKNTEFDHVLIYVRITRGNEFVDILKMNFETQRYKMISHFNQNNPRGTKESNLRPSVKRILQVFFCQGIKKINSFDQ